MAALKENTVRVDFLPRHQPATQATYRRFTEQEETGIVLRPDQVLREQGVMQRLSDRDPARRRRGMQVFNDFSQRCGDLLTGRSSTRLVVTENGRLVNLASAAGFPDQRYQGIPTALRLGDEDQMVDLRWAQLFTVQDRRQQTHPFFKVVDVRHGIEFRVYQLGERIEMRAVAAGQDIFEAEIIAGGLQWNRLWSEWQDIWAEGQGLAAMQREYLMQQARTAYQVLTASGLPTTSYVNRDGTASVTTHNDIATINQAMLDIRRGLYEAEKIGTDGEGITRESVSGQSYYLLYNDLTAGYEERVTTALEARYQMPGDNMNVLEVNRPVVPIGTPDVPAGAWYLFLAGRKNIAAIFRDLMIYDKDDVQIAGVAEGRVGQGAYKMVRGDNQQGREVALS